MITDIIVVSSVVFAMTFLVAWLVRPDLRAWIEQPKYRFQSIVQRYDRARGVEREHDEGPRT